MTGQIGENIKNALNDAQWEAVSYCDGPSLVIAGAGSGKTRVLTYKIAYLLDKGVPPWKILALTFTNKAAREMIERIERIVGHEYTRELWAGTFHSIFARILRKESMILGFTSNYTIYDTSDSKSLIKKIVKELQLDDKKYKASIVASRISEAKNNLLLPDGYVSSPELMRRDSRDGLSQISKIYYIYMQRCRQANAMDFDDLLLYMYLLLKNNPDICQDIRDRFEYILVDEYQDTNPAQYRIIRLLAPENARLCVVGDDSQSIYGFRGAQIENILNFQNDYPTTKLIKLEQNYRSTQTIVSAANSIIEHNRGRIPKTIFSKNEQGEKIRIIEAKSDREESLKVVKQVKNLFHYKSLSYNDVAVLYRTNAQSRTLEDSFRDAGIPYRIYGGQSFYQRKEIKDVIAYLRIIVNPQDEEALLRIINYPARGIGNTTIQKLRSAANASLVTLWDVISCPEHYSMNVNKGMTEKLSAFATMIEGYRSRCDVESAYDLAYGIIRDSGIFADVREDSSPENLSRQENIEEMLNGIRDFETDILEEEGKEMVLLSDYLPRVALITDQDERNNKGDCVTLMTIHSAKGLEFDAVFVTGMEEDLFPNANAKFYPNDMEEERRLFYVAVTRAKKYCFLTYAKQRYQYGKMEFCEPSSFLDEINPQYVQYEGERSRLRVDSPQTLYSDTSSYRTSPRHQSINHTFTPASLENLGKFKKVNTSSLPLSSDSILLPLLKVGDRIEHERFGCGMVRAIEGSGASTKALVEFEYAGTKNLLLMFAKFKVLD